MKRLITFLVIVAVGGYVLFKAGAWWLADQQMAEARSALEDAGVLRRGDIGSGIEGRLILSGGSYQDFRLTQPVTFDRAVLDAGSPVALLALLADPSTLPSRWSLQVTGLRMALEATMFRNWHAAANNGEPALFAPVCGPDHRQHLGSGDLMRLGITALSGELAIKQSPEGFSGELHTEETGSFEVNWPDARLDVTDWPSLAETTDAAVSVTVRDAGLMRRIAAYCSRESGVEVGEWADIVMEAFREGLNARGFEPSRQLQALYRQWLTEGGELAFRLNPSAPVFGLPVREPQQGEEAGEALESEPVLTITYNDAVVPDVYLERIEPEQPDVPEQVLEPLAPDSQKTLVAGWYEADKDEAAQWVGRTVKVTLANDNVVEGRLVSVDDRRIEVARLVDGGEVAYPMALRAVTNFEVWRRGQTR